MVSVNKVSSNDLPILQWAIFALAFIAKQNSILSCLTPYHSDLGAAERGKGKPSRAAVSSANSLDGLKDGLILLLGNTGIHLQRRLKQNRAPTHHFAERGQVTQTPLSK